MSKTVNMVLQTVLLIGSVLALLGNELPEEWKHRAAITTQVLALIVSRVAHMYNEDGTNQKAAFSTDNDKDGLK